MFSVELIEPEGAEPRRTLKDLDPETRKIADDIIQAAFQFEVKYVAETLEAIFTKQPQYEHFTFEQLHDIYQMTVPISLYINNKGEPDSLETLMPETISWGYEHFSTAETLQYLLTKVTLTKRNLDKLVTNPTLITFYNPHGYRYEEKVDQRNLPLSDWSIYYDLPVEIWEEVVSRVVEQPWFDTFPENWYALTFNQLGAQVEFVYNLFRKKYPEYEDAPDGWIAEIMNLPQIDRT